jgi:hypothetical protein
LTEKIEPENRRHGNEDRRHDMAEKKLENEEAIAFNTIIRRLHDLQITTKEIRLEQERLSTCVAEAKHQTQMLTINQDEKTLPTLEHIKKIMNGSGTVGLVDKIIMLEGIIKSHEDRLCYIAKLKMWIYIFLTVVGIIIIMVSINMWTIRDLWRILISRNGG